jgi:hypothetical protein
MGAKQKRPLRLSAMLLLSQVANAAGYFWQKWQQESKD